MTSSTNKKRYQCEQQKIPMQMILLMIGVLGLLNTMLRVNVMLILRFYTFKILRILNIIINNLNIMNMETKIEEMLGIVESKNVKIVSAEYSDIYKNVTIRINEDITSINYTDDTAEVRQTDTIYMSDKQFNFIIDRLYSDELTLLNDMFFGGNLSVKSTCVLLKGATFDVDSTIVPTEHGTMPYRVNRSFKNGKLDKASVKASISFIKSIM